MIERRIQSLVADALQKADINADEFELLASQLVWRIGCLEDGPIVIRVGFAGSVRAFADLPKLKNATDHELEVAIQEGNFRVEWVGGRPSWS